MSIAQSILANPEKYSLQQLTQGVENGVIPAYIGVPIIQEMLQKQAKMQSQMQDASQAQMPPVMDQVMAQAGVETLPSNLPQEYAGGGIIAFQNGGETQAPMRFQNEGLVPPVLSDAEVAAEFERLRVQDQPPTERRSTNLKSFVDAYKSMMPEKDPRLTAYEASITKTPEQLDARKNQDLNLALAQFGLGLMGSKSRTFLGGVSEAAAPVLPSVQAALTSRRTAEDAALKSQAEMARADRAEGIAALTGGIGMYEKDQERSSSLAQEMAKRAAMAAAAPTKIDSEFIKNFSILAKQNPNNKQSDEQIKQNAFDALFKYKAMAQMATAGVAQNTALLNQQGQALTSAYTTFDKQPMSNPLRQKYLELGDIDLKNAKAGKPTDLAGAFRQQEVMKMVTRPELPMPTFGTAAPGVPGAAPPAAPAAAVPSKVMTQADVVATAKARGITTAEVAAAARLAGYTIR